MKASEMINENIMKANEMINEDLMKANEITNEVQWILKNRVPN